MSDSSIRDGLVPSYSSNENIAQTLDVKKNNSDSEIVKEVDYDQLIKGIFIAFLAVAATASLIGLAQVGKIRFPLWDEENEKALTISSIALIALTGIIGTYGIINSRKSVPKHIAQKCDEIFSHNSPLWRSEQRQIVIAREELLNRGSKAKASIVVRTGWRKKRYLVTFNGTKHEVYRLKSDKAGLQFENAKKLGAGGTAEVFKVRDLASGQFKAMKVARVSKIENERNDFYENLLKSEHYLVVEKWQLKHPNVQSDFMLHEDDRDVAISMPLEDSSLADLIEKEKAGKIKLTYADKLNIASQLLQGLRYLNDDKSLWVGDIKPENILMRRDWDGRFIAKQHDFFGAAEMENNRTIDSYTLSGMFKSLTDERERMDKLIKKDLKYAEARIKRIESAISNAETENDRLVLQIELEQSKIDRNEIFIEIQGLRELGRRYDLHLQGVAIFELFAHEFPYDVIVNNLNNYRTKYFAPGSPFKEIILRDALSKLGVPPEEQSDCVRLIKDMITGEPGKMTVEKAIARLNSLIIKAQTR